nr:DNA methyltransferase [uncultured Flavobacterium sp.]
MNIAQIEQNLQDLIQDFNKETFIFELLLAYGLPKASIARLQKGNLNLSKEEGILSWKKKVLFKPVVDEDLHLAISEIKNTLKQEQRFVIVTDFKTLLAIDTKTSDSLDIDFTALPKHFDFFLPWAGMEKAQHQNENPADVKAAEKMAKLFDEIKKDNPDNSPEFTHGLNVFLSRLLFCFFAEDTNIFKKSQFTNAISSHTQTDGSDLNDYLSKLFDVLNTHDRNRGNLPAYLSDFPYVNGGLFQYKHPMPVFTRRSRQAVIDAGELFWSDINPDIFGSMFQAVIRQVENDDNTKHYTSVPDILKLIKPLFLNDLIEEFESAKGSIKKLNGLLARLEKIKIFDPACGSGNFLIIAYKELRKLEIDIINELNILQGKSGSGSLDFGSEFLSKITLNNFYGIELDDFAHEVAKLALWLAEHQLNMEFFKAFGKTNPTLPLRDAGQITRGNACRLNWEEICPKNADDEIYILGNPPYQGARKQSDDQKKDIEIVFGDKPGINSIDYICCWFYKGALYNQKQNSTCAFVTTNSICQGEQISLFWPTIYKLNNEISFAYKPFIWANNAKNKAAVFVVIIGLRLVNNKSKILYFDNLSKHVNNISPYLTDNPNVIVTKKSKPPKGLPELVYGNQAIEGGFLILSPEEKDKLIKDSPLSEKFIRPLYGAEDYMNNSCRYCIWITDNDLPEASSIPEIEQRIQKVKEFRECGGQVAKSLLSIPYRFRYVHEAKKNLLILPRTISERRNYIPVGFLDRSAIVTDATQVIYDPEIYIFSILASKIHILWVHAVAGRLKMDPRYSNSICYNNFPFPKISHSQKDELTQCVFRILEERENHSEKTLAQLYDPDKMPQGLRETHRLNDLAVERCYRSKPFESDEERLEYLFKLYEKMIAEEKEKGTLFNEKKKAKKQK